MPQRFWRSTPRQSIERERDRRGHEQFVTSCCRMLDGDDSDPALIIALGGPGAEDLLDRGLPAEQVYWLRVWAARGLFWVWDDTAIEYVVDAAEDEQWRVREWAAKIIGKHDQTGAVQVLHRLLDDGTPRVRAAATRALADLST